MRQQRNSGRGRSLLCPMSLRPPALRSTPCRKSFAMKQLCLWNRERAMPIPYGIVCCSLILGAALADAPTAAAQQGESSPGAVFRIEVDMVLLNVAVTDSKGNYVTGLRPWDFAVSEDGVPQKVATFGEGSGSPRLLAEFVPRDSLPRLIQPSSRQAGRNLRDGRNPRSFLTEENPERVASLVAGASVFILFDTRNYMYRGFVFAQDAIAEFIRSLDNPDRIALYSYSRNLSRAGPL